ncbi:MAG: hypothetical protein FWD61_14065 [Phycisphaerales bacterium]|nr:hypothetical protein [Phycisphaerales bacterium]
MRADIQQRNPYPANLHFVRYAHRAARRRQSTTTPATTAIDAGVDTGGSWLGVQAAEANKHRELGDAAVKGMAAGTNFMVVAAVLPSSAPPKTKGAVGNASASGPFFASKTASHSATLMRKSAVSQEFLEEICEGNRVSDGSERLS